MFSNLAPQAWQFYRQYGIVKLLSAVNSKRHRLVPFDYRIAIRKRVSEFKYGAGAVKRPLKIFRVSPERIRYNGPIFSHDKFSGTVQSGDWDTNLSTLAQEAMYQGLRERFDNGLDWEDTSYYELAERQFESGDDWLGYTSLESFENSRLPYLDQLYQDIKQEGYRSQSELNGDENDSTRHASVPKYHKKLNEITCNVARDGELLLNNGIHRLSIAKIVGIDEIPIQVIVRHEKWQQIRSDVASSDSPTETALDHGIDPAHPDLDCDGVDAVVASPMPTAEVD